MNVGQNTFRPICKYVYMYSFIFIRITYLEKGKYI